MLSKLCLHDPRAAHMLTRVARVPGRPVIITPPWHTTSKLPATGRARRSKVRTIDGGSGGKTEHRRGNTGTRAARAHCKTAHHHRVRSGLVSRDHLPHRFRRDDLRRAICDLRIPHACSHAHAMLSFMRAPLMQSSSVHLLLLLLLPTRTLQDELHPGWRRAAARTPGPTIPSSSPHEPAGSAA